MDCVIELWEKTMESMDYILCHQQRERSNLVTLDSDGHQCSFKEMEKDNNHMNEWSFIKRNYHIKDKIMVLNLQDSRDCVGGFINTLIPY